MTKVAVSNIGLPPFAHTAAFPALAEAGVSGLEVAPSRVWQDTKAITSPMVESYRRTANEAGLTIVGLHSLFFDQPGLGLFKGQDALEETIAFTLHLSALCRDLGGKCLVYGGGRRRGEMSLSMAKAEAEAYLDCILPVMAEHGTMMCFEPLGPKDTDFLNTAAECLELVRAWKHPALGFQLDAKALVDNGEASSAIFLQGSDVIRHFHANEPGLAVVGSSGQVPHHLFGRCLHEIGYQGWVSVEQRMVTAETAMDDIYRSVRHVIAQYGE